MSFILSRSMLLYFGLALGLDLLLGASHIAHAVNGSLYDPDSYMRLLRLRAELAQGGLTDIVPGDASGEGTILHWSHLFESALAAAAAPLAPFLGWERALRWIGLLCGPVSAGLLGAAVAWSVHPWADRRWLWLAPVATALAPSLAGYGLIGVVHHHIPAAILIVLTVGASARAIIGQPGAGTWAGLAAGAGIWLTPETMPFTLMGFSGLALAWLGAPHRRDLGRSIFACGLSFFALIAVAFLIDPPHTGYDAIEIDRLSLVYLMLGAMIGAIGLTFWSIGSGTFSDHRSALLGGSLALVGLGAWILAFPDVIRGPAALMSPVEADAFFGAIVEMKPVIGLDKTLIYLTTGMLAALYAVTVLIRRRDLPSAWLAACALALVGLGFAHVRFATYGALAGAAALPLCLTDLSRMSATLPAPAAALGRIVTLGLFLLVPMISAGFGATAPAEATTAAAAGCDLRDIGPWLAPYQDAVVLTDPTDAPEVLYRTRLRTTGSLYHRGIAAFMRTRAAWRSRSSADEPADVAATRADYVLVCAEGNRMRSDLVGDLPDDTLLDRLSTGHPPAWLTRESALPGTDLVLYRVREKR